MDEHYKARGKYSPGVKFRSGPNRNLKTSRIFILNVFILLSIVIYIGYNNRVFKQTGKVPPKSSQGEKKEVKNLTRLRLRIRKTVIKCRKGFFQN